MTPIPLTDMQPRDVVNVSVADVIARQRAARADCERLHAELTRQPDAPTLLLPMGAPQVGGVYNLDLFDLCAGMGDQSVDMILCDLPYGTTACEWDSVIPLEPMWAAFKRIIKPRGAIVLTASQPFTSALVMSNPRMFKYSWVWDKGNATGHLNAKHMPLRRHDDVCVFSQSSPDYNPQMTLYDKPRVVNGGRREQEGGDGVSAYGVRERGLAHVVTERYPTTILYFPMGDRSLIVHPTQKPVNLFRYLIRTYTQPGELVFDPCCGSGTTGVAARAEGRRFILGDTSPKYVGITQDRLAEPYTPMLFELDAARVSCGTTDKAQPDYQLSLLPPQSETLETA